jgi:D-3-phosphoglycerate dehydrogenase
MSDYKVLICDGLAGSGKETLAAGSQVDDRSGVSPEELLVIIGDYDAMIVRSRTKVTKQVLDAAKQLKVVGRAGVGVDNIDLAACAAQGVTVVNSPEATTIAVAEHTLALMLSLIRHVPRADTTMKTGIWAKKELRGTELYGKRLGIIGVGRIGCAVSERAQAFGMEVIGYDPPLSDEEIRKRCVIPVSLKEFYATADFISLHVPLTQETRGLLDGQAFAMMKRGVYIVCAARGGVIDETALLARLESGQVAGVALDVFADEPPGLTALVAHPNVIATPHIGAQTDEAQTRAGEHIAAEILAALKGEPLRWKVV